MESSMRVSVVIFLWLLMGCGDSTPNTEVDTPDPCEVSTANYQTVGEPFMRTWCTPCHHSELDGPDRPAGSENINLDTYELVITHLERIEARALGDMPTMPPAGGPTEADLNELSKWLDCGAVRD